MSGQPKAFVTYMTPAEQQEIVIANMRLVGHFLKLFVPSSRYSEFSEDAHNEGMIGLIEAAQRFDPNRGVKFSSFAGFWIKMRIRKYMSDARHVVRPTRGWNEEKVAYRYHRVERDLTQKLGRVPSSHEMIEALCCTRPQYEAAKIRFRRHDAIVSHVDHEDGTYTPSSDEPLPEDAFADAEGQHVTTRTICEALSLLDEKEREVIRRRYLSEPGETLRQIGDSWGRSRERIRQIEVAAMDKLRRVLGAKQGELMGVGA